MFAAFWCEGCDRLDLSDQMVSQARAQAPLLPQSPLRIVTAEGAYDFVVELADDSETRNQGLMYRGELADDTGMLFDFERERRVSMWMKNTLISLDMLFIKANGRIAHIAKNTETESLKSIPSGVPVLAVLEVNAGTADRLRILPGDRIEHPLFDAN
jgi:uncharacterized membrane protein (UPF0127 family)